MRSRPRRPQLIVATAFVLAFATLVLLSSSNRAPHVAVGVTGFSRGGGQLWVQASATNVGSRALVYCGNSPQIAASCRIGDAWTEADPLVPTKHDSYGLLMPGDVWQFEVAIPKEAQRVRVACCFWTAGLRQHLGGRMLAAGLAERWWRLFEMLIGDISAGAARSEAQWSEDVPVADPMKAPHNKSSQATAALRLAFDRSR
jgi:hypothetical protein